MSTQQDEFQKWLDSQSGYVGKGKKAQWNSNYAQNQANQGRLNNVFDPNAQPNFGITGSLNENAGRLDGLERARVLTGKNPYQIGQEYQEAFGNIKKRVDGNDTASELLRANKAGAVAETRQALQAQGVKGGSAVRAAAEVERAKAYDVNNQIQQSQRQAEADYMAATKANANFTQASEMNFGAMAAGRDNRQPASFSGGFGFGGTVICTELYRQGFYPLEIYIADQAYGQKIIKERPEVYIGYRSWADKVVPLMRKSMAFTKLVAFFAVPWAINMAGKKNLFGKVLSVVGESVCGIIGKIILSGERYAIQKEK